VFVAITLVDTGSEAALVVLCAGLAGRPIATRRGARAVPAALAPSAKVVTLSGQSLRPGGAGPRPRMA
jgi:hypothetical protein